MPPSLRQRILLQQQAQHVPADPPRRRHAVDVSNWTSPFDAPKVAEWGTDHDIGMVIIQAVVPPAGYPVGVTRQQIAACIAAGMPLDVYCYLFTNNDIEADMRAKLALLNGLEMYVGRLWLDVEDTSPATPAARITAVRQALAVLDGWATAHSKPRPGVYSGAWYASYLDHTTEFSDRPLWTSQYDGIEDVDVFTPYCGWTAESVAIKQYVGSSALAGVGGLDLNILR